MSCASDDEVSARLFDFLVLYQEDLESGAARPLAEYLARFPGAETAVAAEFERRHALGADGHAPASDGPEEERISHFRVVRRLGTGGQAVVYLAVDERSDRRVALKVLSAPGAALHADRRRRLEREGAILAHLEHPGLCGAEEVDLEHDPPFLVMRFVEGETLRRAVVDRAPPAADRIPRVLRLVEQAARALHASHEAGIVHRDVKPDNIMVTPADAPVVLDFGLARTDEPGPLLTRPGEACGTLAYMSPEQLDESPSSLDRRVDVYALGVTLYECLTGARPFDSPTRARLTHAIRTASVPDPRPWNGAVSRDLRTVLETAMEKNPARRYETALTLAEDLQRLREGRPIRARPVGALVHLVRFGRRHPTFSLSAALAFGLLASGLVIVLALLARVRDERDARDVALRRERGLVYAAAAGGRVLEDDPTFALGLAVEAGRRAPGRGANDALFAALDACWEQTTIDVGVPTFQRDVVIDPSSDTFVVVVGTPAVQWYGCDDGRLRRRVETASPADVVRVSADGTVVVGCQDGSVARVDVETGAVTILLPPGGGPVRDLAQDAAGRRLVVARATGRPWLVDGTGAHPPTALDGHAGPTRHVAFAPDGARFLTGSDEAEEPIPDAAPKVLVRAATDGEVLATIEGHRGELRGACFDPGSARVLTWGRDGAARLFDAADGRPLLPPLEHPGVVHRAAFSPDGAHVATAYDAGTALFDTRDGRCVFRIDSPGERAVCDVAFRPDGERIATASYDLTARILDARDGTELRVLRGHGHYAFRALFTPDGARLVTEENGSVFHLFHLDARPHLPVLVDGAAPLSTACYSPDGGRVVTGSVDGGARVFDAASGAVVARLAPHGGEITGAFFSGDGGLVVTASTDGRARVSDARTGAVVHELAGHGGAILCASRSRDGRRAVTGGADGTAIVHDLASGAAVAALVVAPGTAVTCVRFSPDGALVATGSADRTVRVFDLAASGAGRELVVGRRQRPTQTRVFAVEFHPDGRSVAAAFEGGDTVLAAVDGSSVRPLGPQASPVGVLRFDERGDQVFAAYKWGGRTFVFDSRSGDTIRTMYGHSSSMTAVDLAPDGRLAITTSLDGTARLWRVEDGAEWATIDGHARPLVTACFSPDGRHVLTAGKDGRARIWPTDPLATAERVLPRPPRSEQIDALIEGG